uniref:MYND-type domain-containing protein n=1 Tax=Aureoumbra lagunensis TaxID=44058 RepID=A0A7S3K2R4_9STRA
MHKRHIVSHVTYVHRGAQENFDRVISMGLDKHENYPICGYCGNVSLDILLCGRCRRKYFCGPACIRKAWSVNFAVADVRQIYTNFSIIRMILIKLWLEQSTYT